MTVESNIDDTAPAESLEAAIQAGGDGAAAEALAAFPKSLGLLEEAAANGTKVIHSGILRRRILNIVDDEGARDVRRSTEEIIEAVAQRSYRLGFLEGQATDVGVAGHDPVEKAAVDKVVDRTLADPELGLKATLPFLVRNVAERAGRAAVAAYKYSRKSTKVNDNSTESRTSTTERLEPADFLEEALLSFKPGSRTGEEVAASAMILAGDTPANPSGDLITVAQDLVDNDTRTLEGEL